VTGASPALAATPVTCGAHLTANAKLTADLTCPAGDGVTLDAAVTLDLGGHRLAGSGSGTGVTVPSGVQGAVIRNGSIRDWGRAVGVDGDVSGPEVAASATVRRVSVNGFGITVTGGTVTVERSAFRGTGAPFQSGVAAFMGEFHVSDSTFDGVGLSAGVINEVSVTRSAIRNADTALSCSEAVCSITASRLERNGTVYRGWDSGLTLRGNLIRDNGVGYDARTAFGQPLGGGPDLVERNAFVGNDVAVHFGPGAGTTVRGNVFTGNRRGIESPAFDEEQGTFKVLLQDNALTRNGDAIYLPDAFLPTPTGFSLKGNRAIRNTGWGIYAPRSTDLGGNVARGNGNQPQCVGVAC
jgi:hypothetical protein